MRRWRTTPHENDGMGCRRPRPPLAGDSPRQRGQGGDRPVRHPMPTIFEGASRPDKRGETPLALISHLSSRSWGA